MYYRQNKIPTSPRKMCFGYSSIVICLLLLFLLIAIIVLFLYLVVNNSLNKKMRGVVSEQTQQDADINTVPPTKVDIVPPIRDRTDDNLLIDLNNKITQYDYNASFGAFKEPVRRTSRYEIPPSYLKQMIDIPTRGYPDSFSQIGVLIKKDDKRGDKQISRLYGRQEYPGSYRYEYYTSISSGNDIIKLPVKNKNNKELYDGDKVVLDIDDGIYEVKLFDYDAPKYYPDLVY